MYKFVNLLNLTLDSFKDINNTKLK